jgi:TonB family protein
MSKISVEGVAKLSILVDPAGNVYCISVVSGHPLINGSAVEAAKNWKFKPVIRNGKTLVVRKNRLFLYFAPIGRRLLNRQKFIVPWHASCSSF